MKNKSICRKVSSMLSLYIDNQVTYQESSFIEDHLSNCSECREKYLYLQTLIKDLKSSYRLVLNKEKKKQEQKIFSIREHEKFLDQLYPYVDNELDEKSSYELRKYISTSQCAQEKLKNIYKIQKELKTSYDKIKNSLKTDFSQKIVNELKGTNNNNIIQFRTPVFSSKPVKIALLFSVIIWGGYEFDMFYKQTHKQPIKVPVVQKEKVFHHNLKSNR